MAGKQSPPAQDFSDSRVMWRKVRRMIRTDVDSVDIVFMWVITEKQTRERVVK